MSVDDKQSPDLNPLCVFPTEINDLIFQHVTGAELLTISEVSPNIYNFIADCRKCMKKVKVKIAKKEFIDDDKISLIEGRKYQNIEIAQFSENIKPAKEIIKEKDFTNVVIRCLDFETIADAVEFFTILEPKIENLQMDQVYIKSVVRRHDNSAKKLQFPKLNVLDTKCCQALLYHEVFVNCTTLTTFVIKSGSHISTAAHEAIKTMLQSNERIEILGIHFNVFNLLFNENIGEFVRFKLKEFHANDLYRVPRFYFEVKSNLRSFLLSQMETLEAFSIGDWMGIDVMKIIFHMPRLKNLTMKGFHHTERFIEWEDLELCRNMKITKMDFNDMSNNFKILEKIIGAAPNLNSLKLYSMDQKTMEFISSNCKALTSLYVEHFHPADVSNGDLFKNLQDFSCRKIDNSLKNEIKEALTHFEKLIFK